MSEKAESKPDSKAEASPKRRRVFGLFSRRERWGLSARGWLVLFLSGLAFTGFMLFAAHPFLAVTKRVNAEVFVVEGWVHAYAINAAVTEFKAGGYPKVYTTGGPVVGLGGYVNDWQTAASVGADELKKAGLPAEFVQMVPSRVMTRDRTYGSAVALRKWFEEHGIKVRALNVLTEDAHSRRTRLLFQEAFGDDVQVGVISVACPDYDAKQWWRYSEGVREVLSESIAYLYARILFRPTEN